MVFFEDLGAKTYHFSVNSKVLLHQALLLFHLCFYLCKLRGSLLLLGCQLCIELGLFLFGISLHLCQLLIFECKLLLELHQHLRCAVLHRASLQSLLTRTSQLLLHGCNLSCYLTDLKLVTILCFSHFLFMFCLCLFQSLLHVL